MLVGKFVRVCAAAAGATIAASAAQAGDLYSGNGCNYGGCGYKDEGVYIPPPLWQGFYIGGFAGVAWGSAETSGDIIILTNSGIVPLSTLNGSGLYGGGQLGYNFQFGRFIYGIEADLGGMDIGTSLSFTNPSLAKVFQVSSSGGFYGDITTRAGMLFGNAFVYGKAGWAYLDGDVRLSDGVFYLDSNSFSGWTVGAGVEYMVAPDWTIKAEYQYFDLSNNSGSLGSEISASTLKIGFNWFMHSVPLPLY